MQYSCDVSFDPCRKRSAAFQSSASSFRTLITTCTSSYCFASSYAGSINSLYCFSLFPKKILLHAINCLHIYFSRKPFLSFSFCFTILYFLLYLAQKANGLLFIFCFSAVVASKRAVVGNRRYKYQSTYNSKWKTLHRTVLTYGHYNFSSRKLILLN